MSGASGTRIPASDYNSIQSTIATVMGVPATGSTNGYNQTLTSAQLVAGNTIRAANWQSLYTDISRAYTHITGAAPAAGTLPAITAGTVVKASDISLYSTAATYCSTNRLTVAAANLTTVAPVAGSTITRASTWGQSAGGIACQMNVTWASEAAAAAFFNTGGYITMKLAHPSTASTQDTAWNAFLSGFGTFVFSGTGSAKGGGNGTMTSLAYSATVGGGTQVLNAAMTTASYTANYVTVTYYKITNGLAIIVLLEDNHTNSFYDVVQAGSNAAFGYVKATDTGNLPTAQGSPTFGIVTNF